MPRENEFLTQVENLSFSYPSGETILRDISVSLPRASLNILMGPSGSGKTTFFKIWSGLLRPSQGNVMFAGSPVTPGMPLSLRARIGYIPQQLGLVRNLSVLENTLMGCLARCRGFAAALGIFPAAEKETALLLLRKLGIEHKADEKAGRLSGGERQRVAIARSLMQRPEFILADEFISDLDVKTAEEILSLVRGIQEREQVAFMVSMHDCGLARKLGGRIFFLKRGELSVCPPEWELTQAVYEEMTR